MTGVFQYFASSTLLFEVCDFEIVLYIDYNKGIIQKDHLAHKTESFNVLLHVAIILLSTSIDNRITK